MSNEDIKNENSNAAPTTDTQQSYAVRPRREHHRRLDYSDHDNMLGTRNKLNMAFMALAIIGAILWNLMDDHTVAAVVLIVGVALKIAEVCIRLFHR